MKKKKVLKKHHVQKRSKPVKKNYKSKKHKVVRHHKKHRRPYKKRVAKTPVVVTPPTPVVAIVPTPPVKESRGRKPRGSSVDKMYFTQDTETSIIAYNATDDYQTREDIYNNKIKYPFEKLVENIFNTFKFSYFETGPLDVQKETVAHLVSNIHKYDPSKGKAFAYFSIVAKHYLIALNNSVYKRRNQHVEIGEEHDEHTVQLQTEDKHYKESEMKEFMNLMILFWENNVGKIFTKQRDLDIANAVIELFRNSDRIDAFNKKALYLYIREISSCKTQQITKVINKMKQYQSNISRSYTNQGSINTENYIKV
jgi:hypothetical protein